MILVHAHKIIAQDKGMTALNSLHEAHIRSTESCIEFLVETPKLYIVRLGDARHPI
jgi:hypothetical protein